MVLLLIIIITLILQVLAADTCIIITWILIGLFGEDPCVIPFGNPFVDINEHTLSDGMHNYKWFVRYWRQARLSLRKHDPSKQSVSQFSHLLSNCFFFSFCSFFELSKCRWLHMPMIYHTNHLRTPHCLWCLILY